LARMSGVFCLSSACIGYRPVLTFQGSTVASFLEAPAIGRWIIKN
jgi:hypothetical protein